jgi:hypothetical protein
MDYFGGLSFIGGNDCPAYGGVMEYRIGGNPIRRYNGSFVFISRPGIRFHYGSPPGQHRHHCYVCFKGPRVAKYIQGGLISRGKPTEPTPVASSEKFLSSMRKLLEILHERHQGFTSPRAVLLFEDLLL